MIQITHKSVRTDIWDDPDYNIFPRLLNDYYVSNLDDFLDPVFRIQLIYLHIRHGLGL